MELLENIFLHSKQTISDQELQRIAQESDYELFHTQVEKFVESGVLVPVKSSKTNGRIPPLFNRYRIIKPQEDFSAYLESVRRLNPLLNIAGYLQRPELYKKHLEIVEGLSRYLWFARELLEQPMSRKERSFSVWGREKFLDEHLALVREVLKFNRIEESFLNFYDTPEPFFEYHHQPSELKTVLVIENKDTWFTLRKLMQTSGKNNIAGTEVNVLLYGEGNKITKKGALEEYKTTMLGGQNEIRFLYFGDLDWEGIRLFFRAREANPSLDIKPFSYLYRLMLELAESVELPRSLDQRGVVGPLHEFLSLLGLTDESSLSSILAEGRYIPQEIVNYQVAAKILK